MWILSRSGPRAVQGGGNCQRGGAEYVWQGVDAPDWILHSSACRDTGETSGTFCMCIDCCSLCVHALVVLFQLSCSVGKGPIHFKPPIAKYICLSICPCVWALPGRCLLNCSTFWNQMIWWYIIMSQSIAWKNTVTIFRVTVPVRAYVIRIWLVLPYLLNYFYCIFWMILLQANFSVKIGWLCSGSRSKWRFRISVGVFLDDIFWTLKVDMSAHHHTLECHAKIWVAIFKGKVTVRAYIVWIWLFLLYRLNCFSFCNQTYFDGTSS